MDLLSPAPLPPVQLLGRTAQVFATPESHTDYLHNVRATRTNRLKPAICNV